jgi:hypothetical protein
MNRYGMKIIEIKAELDTYKAVSEEDDEYHNWNK